MQQFASLPAGELQYLFSVAAGVPPAPEPGILPGGFSHEFRRQFLVQSSPSGRQDAALYGSQDGWHVFSTMVGMARCAVPARVVAGGTITQTRLAIEGVAPLHAARTSQRDVPAALNRYDGCRYSRKAALI